MARILKLRKAAKPGGTEEAPLPPVEPVTVAELKLYLQIEGTAYDTALETIITAARLQVEHYANVSLVASDITLHVVFDNDYPLPYSPVDAISSIKWKKCPAQWLDQVEGEDYDLNNGVISASEMGKFVIEYSTLPDTNHAFKQAVLLQAGHMYNNRDNNERQGWDNQALALLNAIKNAYY